MQNTKQSLKNHQQMGLKGLIKTLLWRIPAIWEYKFGLRAFFSYQVKLQTMHMVLKKHENSHFLTSEFHSGCKKYFNDPLPP